MGNPDLLNEETTNYEMGMSFTGYAVMLNGSVFYKEGRNIIDWVRASVNDIWTVRNETNLNTAGFEAGIVIFPRNFIKALPIPAISVNYTYLSMDRSTSLYQSKYALDHLKHQLIFTLDNDLPFGIKQKWTVRYESREGFEDHLITDTRIIREFTYFSISLRADNLFNKSYMDYFAIPLPGRWISASIHIYNE
jgi:iron complex outermembrane receptor protein